ncbi:MAG TPA: hypothetical protein VFO19_16995 [Vicinamibacterales bacterium]|nr:hypothetical protein [Vicinamibacterales bacterium]
MAAGDAASPSDRLAMDTSSAIEQMQVAAWREMSPEKKTAVIRGMTQAVLSLALAGIREHHPDASPDGQRLRLTVLLRGRELATRAFPAVAVPQLE